MASEHNTGRSRIQTALLAAIAGLLALDVGDRFFGTQADDRARPGAIPVAYQPEEEVLGNPLEQRRVMIAQLKNIDRRITALDERLRGKIRVEVTNFPAPEKAKD